MASYRGHLSFSTALGATYAGLGFWYFGWDWGPPFVAGGLTALGGLLPDLDSDSGVPLRELFNLAAAFTPLLLLHRLMRERLTDEQILAVMAGSYLFVRFVVRFLFQRLSVHRGMFHSLPAMAIAGLLVYLLHIGPNRIHWIYYAGGIMLGFLSHLVLDELCTVNFLGGPIRLNKFAGSALKFVSRSWLATGLTYGVLAALGFLFWVDKTP